MRRRPLATTSVRDALDSAVIALTAAGCDTPRLDAEVLLAHVLGTDRTQLFLSPGQGLTPDEAHAFMDAARRRREREPVAYIVGFKDFRRVRLEVNRHVLIPRPETETLVEAATAELPDGAHVVDVGTGSGAIACALADERPDLRLAATDTSADALAVARTNAPAQVELVHGDLLAGLEPDAVVANLPYVEDGAELQPEIARYEPAQALFAGADGLDAYRRLIGSLPRSVRWVGLECGMGQADALGALLRDGFGDVRALRDLAGIERVVVGSRS